MDKIGDMILAGLFVAAVVAATTFLLANPLTNPLETSTVERALDALDDGRSEDALKLADEAIAVDAADAEAQSVRGWSLFELGDSDAALASANAALGVDAEDYAAQLLKGRVLEREGALSDSHWHLRRARDIGEGKGWPFEPYLAAGAPNIHSKFKVTLNDEIAMSNRVRSESGPIAALLSLDLIPRFEVDRRDAFADDVGHDLAANYSHHLADLWGELGCADAVDWETFFLERYSRSASTTPPPVDPVEASPVDPFPCPDIPFEEPTPPPSAWREHGLPLLIICGGCAAGAGAISVTSKLRALFKRKSQGWHEIIGAQKTAHALWGAGEHVEAINMQQAATSNVQQLWGQDHEFTEQANSDLQAMRLLDTHRARSASST